MGSLLLEDDPPFLLLESGEFFLREDNSKLIIGN